MARGGLALALVALASAAVALAAPAGADPVCDAAWDAARAVTTASQNDAYSGRDAGDVPADAVRVKRLYSWGTLDPPVARYAADLADWLHVDVTAPTATVFMAQINATVLHDEYRYVTHGVPNLADATPEALRFSIDLYDAGGALLAAGTPSGGGGENVTVVLEESGRYFFRAGRAHVVGEDVGCAGARANPTLPASTGADAANYGVYVGCRPMCFQVSLS